jgi:CBS domain-containing protein
MRVSDAMTRSPIAVPEDASVRSALELLETMEIRHLPVVDGHGFLVGLVSERDLHAFYAPRRELAGDWAAKARENLDLPVSRIMLVRPIVVEDDAPLERAVEILLREKVSAVPVVHGGKLVGIVSFVDLLGLLVKVLPRL